MSLYIKEPYKKKMFIRISSSLTSKGYKHFLLEDTIVTPPIKYYTKGDIAKIDGQLLEVDQDLQGNTKYMAENLKEDADALIEIDWTHRLQMMQDNIGRIILRLCLKELEGLEPTFESTEDTPYFLLDLSDLGFQSVEKLEDLANRIIQSNLPIPYKNGDTSQVQIGQYPAQKSFGPKLNSTGEVALLAIGPIEKTESGLKLYFHAGQKALKDYKNHRGLARNLGIFFQSEEPSQIWSEVKKLKRQIEDLKKDKKELETALGLEEVNEFLSYKKTLSDVSYIYRVLTNVNFKNIKNVLQNIQQKKKHIQIYGIPNGAEAQIIVASSLDMPVNLKKTMDQLSKKYPLEGTGNLFKIQANCPYYLMREIMEEFLLQLQGQFSKSMES